MPKARIYPDYDSKDEAKAATDWAAAQAPVMKAPRKTNKTSSESFIKKLLQTLTTNQSRTQQILQERAELTDQCTQTQETHQGLFAPLKYARQSLTTYS